MVISETLLSSSVKYASLRSKEGLEDQDLQSTEAEEQNPPKKNIFV